MKPRTVSGVVNASRMRGIRGALEQSFWRRNTGVELIKESLRTFDLRTRCLSAAHLDVGSKKMQGCA